MIKNGICAQMTHEKGHFAQSCKQHERRLATREHRSARSPRASNSIKLLHQAKHGAARKERRHSTRRFTNIGTLWATAQPLRASVLRGATERSIRKKKKKKKARGQIHAPRAPLLMTARARSEKPPKTTADDHQELPPPQSFISNVPERTQQSRSQKGPQRLTLAGRGSVRGGASLFGPVAASLCCVTILRGVPGRQRDVSLGRNLASLFRGSASLFRGQKSKNSPERPIVSH